MKSNFYFVKEFLGGSLSDLILSDDFSGITRNL